MDFTIDIIKMSVMSVVPAVGEKRGLSQASHTVSSVIKYNKNSESEAVSKDKYDSNLTCLKFWSSY